MKIKKLFLSVLSLVFVFPLVYLLVIGFSKVSFDKLFVEASNSILLAVFSVLLSLLLAIPSAYVYVYQLFKVKTLFGIFIFILAIIPPFILSILFVNLGYFFNIDNGLGMLIVSHSIVIFPYSFIFAIIGFNYVPKQMHKGSFIYCSSFFKRFYFFYFPYMKNALFVAFLFGISISLSQYVLTLMLSTPGFSTLILEMVPYLHSADIKRANTYGLVVIFFSFFTLFIVYNFFRKNRVLS